MFKVLVAEDEKLIREGIAGVLRGTRRMEVFTARNGEEALRILSQTPVDGMILDIKMPGKDGIQVLESASGAGAPLPVVIVLSGYDDFSFAQRVIPYGIAEYVLKPLSPQKAAELAERLLGLMERDRAQRPRAPAVVQAGAAAGPGSPLSDQVARYIEAHLAEEISNEILSTAFRYSSNYLGQLFKKQKGMSISEFVTARRVQEAKRLLLEEQMTVSEVAYRAGFNDNHYFCTVFKRLTGLTPKEFRAAGRRSWPA